MGGCKLSKATSSFDKLRMKSWDKHFVNSP